MHPPKTRGFMRVEWPTFLLICATYGALAACLFWLPEISLTLAILALIPVVALHSSLQHEVTHGHPFAERRLGEILVFPSLNLVIPYLRFRDTHLAHHMDATLTDPYDDPESNYLDPAVWARLPRPVQWLLNANNTLLGRMILGPVIGQVAFMAADLRAIRAGDRAVLRGWLWHLPAAGRHRRVGADLRHAALGLRAGLLRRACRPLRYSTFLEHQAHERARGAQPSSSRIAGRWPSCFSTTTCMSSTTCTPSCPGIACRGSISPTATSTSGATRGYRYDSYAQIFRRHLLRAKDPVPHPLYPQK